MDKKTSEYHIWWVFVLTDRLSTASRKRLERKGFSNEPRATTLKRHCPSLEKAQEMQAEVQECLRAGERVETILITDKQFGMRTVAYGR
mgnify:CR=1 FL=1